MDSLPRETGLSRYQRPVGEIAGRRVIVESVLSDIAKTQLQLSILFCAGRKDAAGHRLTVSGLVKSEARTDDTEFEMRFESERPKSRHVKTVLAMVAVCLLLCVGASLAAAEPSDSPPESVKDAATKIGHATRDASRSIGHAIRDATREVGHASRDAWNETAEGRKEAKATRKSAWQEFKKDVRDAWRKITGSGDS